MIFIFDLLLQFLRLPALKSDLFFYLFNSIAGVSQVILISAYSGLHLANLLA